MQHLIELSLVLKNDRLGQGLQVGFVLLANETESVVFEVLVGSHFWNSDVLVVVKVLLDWVVNVVALRDLEEGGKLQLGWR